MSTPIKSSTIRPGLLVSLASTVKGGVSYKRVDLDAAGEIAQEGTDVARWETTRVIEDKDEYERAVKTRNAAISLIRRECQATSFGLLCSEEHEGALDAAIHKAREMVDAHNADAAHTRISVYALKGRVASNDAEAARAITSEISMLVSKMDSGIQALDAEGIRKAANQARELSAMLDDSLKAKVDGAIAQARKAARDITRRIEKNAEDKAIVLADIQRGQIESARIAFLDLSDAPTPTGEALPAIDAQRFADIDADDEPSEQCGQCGAEIAGYHQCQSGDSEPADPTKRQAIPRLDLSTSDAMPRAIGAPSSGRALELV